MCCTSQKVDFRKAELSFADDSFANLANLNLAGEGAFSPGPDSFFDRLPAAAFRTSVGEQWENRL
jgi:hypothetical protein